MIRFLDSAGLPAAIYAVEVDAQLYMPEEVAAIVRAATEPSCADPPACGLCGVSVTQKPLGRKRKYCDGCAARLGHRTSEQLSRRMARKSTPGEN